MVHSELYLNKYVVSIANNDNYQLDQPVITRITSPHPLSENCSFAYFRFLIFHPFLGGSADPVCLYVRTPMGQGAVLPCGWEGNRRSGVALAMRHGLQLSIHFILTHGLRKGDEHPAYTLRGIWHTLTFACIRRRGSENQD